MTCYKVTYQTRHKNSPPGMAPDEWKDEELTIVAEDDAMEAIKIITDRIPAYYFRLCAVNVCGHVDAITRRLCVLK